MKKYTFLLLIITIQSIVFSQSGNKDSKTTKDSILKGQALFEDMLKNASTNKYKSKMGSVSSQMNSTYHGQNGNIKHTSKKKNDFGSSKYDSEINWATDIDENDIQGSLNKFRKQRREEELRPYVYSTIGAVILSFVLFAYYVSRKG